jgi:hypothetical protein
MSAFETLNACGVTASGKSVVVLLPRREFTQEEALMFAAWLVAMATIGAKEPFDTDGELARFPQRVEAVLST